MLLRLLLLLWTCNRQGNANLINHKVVFPKTIWINNENLMIITTHFKSAFATAAFDKLMKPKPRNGVFGINTSVKRAFGSIFCASSLKKSLRRLTVIFLKTTYITR